MALKLNRGAISLLTLTLFSFLVITIALEQNSKSDNLNAIGSEQSLSASTNNYGEPIKWSFGGWNPLDKGNNKTNGARTSPIPPSYFIDQQHTTINQTAQSRHDRPRGSGQQMHHVGDASGNNVHYASPPQQTLALQQPQAQQQQQYHQRDHTMQPAYAVAQFSPELPPEYSAPAPTPLIREHPLGNVNHDAPMMNNDMMHQHEPKMPFRQQQQQQHHRGPQNGPYNNPMMMPSIGPSHQSTKSVQHHQRTMNNHHDHGHMSMRPPMSPQIPPHHINFHRQHQRNMQRHRDHVMRHHHMMMAQHQDRMRAHGQEMIPHHFRGKPNRRRPSESKIAPNWTPFNGQNGHIQGKRIPMPPRPMYQQPHSLPMNQLNQVQAPPQNGHRAAKANGGFRIIEGEQPLIFNVPIEQQFEQRQPPPLPQQQQQQPDQQQPHHPQEHQQAINNNGNSHNGQPIEPEQQPQQHPSMRAIETDNLNYHNALSQAEDIEYQRKPTGNNIQEVKQSQLPYNNQANLAMNTNNNDNNNNSSSSSGSIKSSSYLTIPVAVETEGDKVLTADDINEIEKQVINVLPNLKTADKVVKLADAHLTLDSIKNAAEQQQQQQQQQQQYLKSGPSNENQLHQVNYQEHQAIMKQLEADMPTSRVPDQTTAYVIHQTSTTTNGNAPTNSPTDGPRYGSSASTASVEHQQPNELSEPQQYFVAAGPMEEIATVDPEQMNEYQFIKNDLLQSIRYEPTRASSTNGHNQQQYQTGSTPPMPNQNRPHSARPSVTRYFHQGHRQPQSAGHRQNMGGRQHNGRGKQQGYSVTPPTETSSRTTLGGRKVSEVMRPLIHTTPVPMTSPAHVPSVEPDKLDAIQLIAGQANDRQPLVVESHQLVHHTPDGGIDYNSGSPTMTTLPAPFNHSSGPIEHIEHTTLINHQIPQQQQQQQAQSQPQSIEYGNGQPPGAMIEYVTLTEHALGNSLNGQYSGPATVATTAATSAGSGSQTYEVNGQPEIQTLYVNAEQGGTDQQVTHDQGQQRGQPQYSFRPIMESQTGPMNSESIAVTPPTIFYASGQAEQANQQLQQNQIQQPSLAWSPSVASEHQQQQLELGEHAGPMQQLEMPATAGYNNFFNQGSSSMNGIVEPTAHQLEHMRTHQQQQQQGESFEQPQQEQHNIGTGKWKTKAGGSLPNPDAQYDGQIDKTSSQLQQDPENHSQQQQQQIEITSSNEPQPMSNYLIQLQQQQQQQHSTNNINQQGDAYLSQQSNHNRNNDHSIAEQNGLSRQAAPSEPQLSQTNQNDGGYMSSLQSYPSQEQHQQQQEQSRNEQNPFGYVKLDQGAQQSHLAQHQAKHQIQLQELSSPANLRDGSSYGQSTTPTIGQQQTTQLPPIEQSLQQNENNGYQQQANQQQQQHEQQQQQLQKDDQQQQQTFEQSKSSYDTGSQQDAIPTMLVAGDQSIHQIPIIDQQSLIPDPNQEQTNYQFISADDENAKRSQPEQSQPEGVYQVYQAYYAPRDHKPLPGYVRLSINEFNELFRDAEIQYVDKNLSGLLKGQNLMLNGNQNNNYNNISSIDQTNEQTNQQMSSAVDMMKGAASENHSILIDRRSIPDNRTTSEIGSIVNASRAIGVGGGQIKTRLGQAVKKIISIKNSRHLNKTSFKVSKLLNNNNDNNNQETTTRDISSQSPKISDKNAHSIANTSTVPTTSDSSSSTKDPTTKLVDKKDLETSHIKSNSKKFKKFDKQRGSLKGKQQQ